MFVSKRLITSGSLLFWLCVALLVLVFPLVASAYYTSLAVFAGLYAIAAMGLNILFGRVGQVSVGHAALYGIGAYVSAILTTRFDLNPWISLFLAGAVGGLVGFLIGKVCARLRHDYLALATLAFNVAFVRIATAWTEMTGGASGIAGIPALQLGKFRFDDDVGYFYLVWGAVSLALLSMGRLLNSRFGRTLSAVRENEIAALACGIDVGRYRAAAFALSGIYTGWAGGLFAHYSRVVGPDTGSIHLSLILLTIVVIGGMDSIWGGLIGAIIVTALPALIRFVTSLPVFPSSLRFGFMDSSILAILTGVLMYLFILGMPHGLAGRFQAKHRVLRDSNPTLDQNETLHN